MSDMSASDRAIKKSAEAEPEFVARPSAKVISDGILKDAILKTVIDSTPSNYTHVKVFNYPEFFAGFDFYRVNFYYEHDTDPTTTINSFEVKVSDVKLPGVGNEN